MSEAVVWNMIVQLHMVVPLFANSTVRMFCQFVYKHKQHFLLSCIQVMSIVT